MLKALTPSYDMNDMTDMTVMYTYIEMHHASCHMPTCGLHSHVLASIKLRFTDVDYHHALFNSTRDSALQLCKRGVLVL